METNSALETHLGFWLRRVSNRVSGEFARALQTKGLSVAEWVALRVVHQHEKLTPGQLAAAVAMTPGAISKIVDKVASKGLMVRVRDAADGRAQWLSLTRSGARLLPTLARLADENDDFFFGGLARSEQATLLRLLKKLAERHRLHDVPTD